MNITEKLENLIKYESLFRACERCRCKEGSRTDPPTAARAKAPRDWVFLPMNGGARLFMAWPGLRAVTFKRNGTEYAYATSFANPITMSAAFDDDLIYDIASVVSTEGRAFSNAGLAGLDFWTPNINPYKDPRWGRGSEVCVVCDAFLPLPPSHLLTPANE